MEKHSTLSQRENYVPSQLTEILWWFSTAEKELLADAVVDRNRYRIVGMTVLATWAFATIAWTYFFTTVTANSWLSVPLGFFMGFIILTIDRALIKGITKTNKQRLFPLLLRGALAITIGVFMAQPALLYMFKKEIALQTSLDNEKKKMMKKKEVDALYKDRLDSLNNRKTFLLADNEKSYKEVAAARNNFIAETDGSGGTGKVGVKAVALVKKNEYDKLNAAYEAKLLANKPLLDNIDVEQKAIADSISKEQAVFASLLNDGFLTQIEALNNLIRTNPALQYRYYLLVTILLLIELMPVIAKTLLPSGTYDERALLRETMEKEIAQSNARKEQELKEQYNTMAQQHDMEAITSFFELTKEDRTNKIKSFSQRWKEEKHETFDGLWEKMKKEILSKQEN